MTLFYNKEALFLTQYRNNRCASDSLVQIDGPMDKPEIGLAYCGMRSYYEGSLFMVEFKENSHGKKKVHQSFHQSYLGFKIITL